MKNAFTTFKFTQITKQATMKNVFTTYFLKINFSLS